MSVSKSQKPLPQVVCRNCYLSTLARPWRKKCLHCATELPNLVDPEEACVPSESGPQSRSKRTFVGKHNRRRKVA